jgi:tetratricopeptide (TPR) repeat protein
MKSIHPAIYLILFFVFNFECAKAQYETAIKLYDQKKYNEAWYEWKKLLDAGAKGESVYYNTANTYYQMHQYPEAILYFNKALKWNPNCNDCKKNLKLAQKAAGVESFELPEFFISNWYKSILLLLQPLVWISIGIILVSIFIWLLFFKNELNLRKQTPLIFYSFIILILTCFVLGFHREQIRQKSDQLILMESSGLYFSPDTLSESKQQLLPGQQLILKDQIRGWFKVQTPEFDLGWIELNKVKKIQL